MNYKWGCNLNQYMDNDNKIGVDLCDSIERHFTPGGNGAGTQKVKG